MKIRTTGLLAGASMALTMITVWAVTPAGGFGERVEERAELLGSLPAPGAATVSAAAERWKFEDGSSSLRVEGRLGHATLAAGQDNETFVYLNVRSPTDAAAQATPVDLAIVIDRSGSMQGKRMQNAIDAARGIVRRLRDGDSVSVTTYNTVAETLVPRTVIGPANREDVVARLAGITANGDTCISCGLEAGMRALEASAFTGGVVVKRMLLLSDGQATAGIRDEQGFRSLAARVREMGCSISSIGVDVDYNQRVMSALATESNGRHYFVDNAAALPQIFEEELTSIARVVASDAEVRLSLGPGVQLLQVFDRTFRREGDALVVPMGTFTAGEEKTVLVKVRVPRGAAGERPVADVQLRFRDLVDGRAGLSAGSLLTALTSDTPASPLDPLVGARLGRASTTALLREANSLFEQGDVDGARNAIARQRAALRRQRDELAPAPKGRGGEVDGDFERQDDALAKADGGFAQPPPSPAVPPQAARPGKAQVRANEEMANAFGF
jgi:Ca-activated chloride channel family protein